MMKIVKSCGVMMLICVMAITLAGCPDPEEDPDVYDYVVPRYTMLQVDEPAIENKGVYELKVGERTSVYPITTSPLGKQQVHGVGTVEYEVKDESGVISYSKYDQWGGYYPHQLFILAQKPGIVTVVARVKWANTDGSFSGEVPWFTAKATIRVVDENGLSAGDNEDFSTEFHLDYSPKNPRVGEKIQLQTVGLTSEQQAKGSWNIYYLLKITEEVKHGGAGPEIGEDGTFTMVSEGTAFVTFIYGTQVKHLEIEINISLEEDSYYGGDSYTEGNGVYPGEVLTIAVAPAMTSPPPPPPSQKTLPPKTLSANPAPPKTLTEKTVKEYTASPPPTESLLPEETLTPLTPKETLKPTNRVTTTGRTTTAASTAASSTAATTPTTSSYVPVAKIDGVPRYVIDGKTIELKGNVRPANATKKQIEWSIVKGEGYKVSLVGNKLKGLDASSEGTHPVIRATIKDGLGKGKDYVQNFTIEVPYDISVFPEGKLIGATVSNMYTQEIQAMNGAGAPYTFRVTSGSLPNGLILAADSNDKTKASITGTPTAAGTSAFTIRVTDGDGNYKDFDYSLEVKGTTRVADKASLAMFAVLPPSLPEAKEQTTQTTLVQTASAQTTFQRTTTARTTATNTTGTVAQSTVAQSTATQSTGTQSTATQSTGTRSEATPLSILTRNAAAIKESTLATSASAQKHS